MTKGGAVGLGLTLAYLGYTKRDLVMSSLNLNKNVWIVNLSLSFLDFYI